LASSGETTAPCGVPRFVSDHWPSSDTPALSHLDPVKHPPIGHPMRDELHCPFVGHVCRRTHGYPAGASEVSRFSCMKLPDVSGVYDTQDRARTRDAAPAHVAFRRVKSVGVLIASFRSSIPSPPVPLFTLRRTPHDVQRKTRGRVVRYSFLVGLLHSLLHAGLPRRTDSAIWRQPKHIYVNPSFSTRVHWPEIIPFLRPLSVLRACSAKLESKLQALL